MIVKPAFRWLLLGAVAVQAACAPTAAPAARAPATSPGVTQALALPEPTATRLPSTAAARPAAATATQPDTPASASDSLFAPVTEADWQKGPADARLTIIEYGDYQ